MIKTILASVTHNPHYLNKYINFITNCQTKNKNYTGYTERHHICPKAKDMFPEFASFTKFTWNCANLTARQHYIAHLLLYKTYPSIISQQQALFLMSHTMGLKINSKLHDKIRLEYSNSKKGFITVKDAAGKTFNVSINDSSYTDGELVGVNKGRVTVTDAEGKTYQVSTTDPRYLSGELVSINKGLIVVKDSVGKIYKVSKVDSRYLSGELVSINKGTISKNRAITDKQVREIRLAIKNPTAIITDEYISSVVKASQRDKVGKIPFSNLKYKNGTILSYKNLLTKYYTDKYSVDRNVILGIIDGKMYKEITT